MQYRGRRAKRVRNLKSRVVKVTTVSGWEAVLKRAGSKPVVVMFGAANVTPCKHMQPIYADISKDVKNKGFVFCDIDVHKLPAVAEKAGVEKLPTYAVFKDGEKVEMFSGGTPSKLLDMLNRYRPPRSATEGGSGALKWVVGGLGALAVAAAGAWYAVAVAGWPGGGESTESKGGSAQQPKKKRAEAAKAAAPSRVGDEEDEEDEDEEEAGGSAGGGSRVQVLAEGEDEDDDVDVDSDDDEEDEDEDEDDY
ncbi:unnamed protein product [Pedinophyceae sp. YPF-701]|nr:unnamed protein product [Pedinophyceae sp. YPF-701]